MDFSKAEKIRALRSVIAFTSVEGGALAFNMAAYAVTRRSAGHCSNEETPVWCPSAPAAKVVAIWTACGAVPLAVAASGLVALQRPVAAPPLHEVLLYNPRISEDPIYDILFTLGLYFVAPVTVGALSGVFGTCMFQQAPYAASMGTNGAIGGAMAAGAILLGAVVCAQYRVIVADCSRRRRTRQPVAVEF